MDTAHGFQGDERDLIIFSPVVSANMPDASNRFLGRTPNLFNVAITRARAALVIVGDHTSAKESSIEHLSSFARYVERLGIYAADAPTHEDYGPQYPPVANPEQVSHWEHALYQALYARGLKPRVQHPVEQYTLDFGLFDGNRKLNIEVDGERYHREWDGELARRDVIRNQRLIELGWDVMRFWVYQVRDELDQCLDRIQTWAESSHG